MRVDTIKLKKGSSELTSECRELIEQLTKCRTRSDMLQFLESVHVWIYGKCELYHWIEILDRFDKILEEASRCLQSNEFVLHCDKTFASDDVRLLLLVLNFTTLLIEHSFSRHLYNSIEHLTQLLSSQNMDIVLAVLNLLYMFSKRSNFIPRLPFEKKELLIIKLFNVAERWGDPNYGLSLKDCCIGNPKLEFLYQLCIDYIDETGHAAQLEIPDMMVICRDSLPSEVIKSIADQISKPSEAIKMRIAHRVRLISGFNNYKLRLQFVQARLQAVSILIYSNALQDNTDKVLYPGFGEELCELIDKEEVHLVEIRAAVLRTLTSMLHFDRNPNVQRAGSRLIKIIQYTGAERQGGILPLLVRDCIDNLTANGLTDKYPLILATSLFSLLYHLASYEHGGHALVKSGMMQSLLRVISWPGVDLEHITFVTRAVRVIDLITNIDIAKFHQNNGLNVFIDRLEKEVISCSKALAEIGYNLKETNACDESMVYKQDTASDCADDDDIHVTCGEHLSERNMDNSSGSNSVDNSNRNSEMFRLYIDFDAPDINMPTSEAAANANAAATEAASSGHINADGGNDTASDAVGTDDTAGTSADAIGISPVVQYPPNSYYARPFSERKSEMSQAATNNIQPKKPSCVTQRAALLKSMLNFLKKSIQDHAHFSNMRNIMETSLTQSLRHIIANAEYYGPSLFLLATDVVTVYVFNEPSLLSSLQDLGITSVMLKALLEKDVPPTREVLGSIPNVFSALCLNERGLMEFMSYDPFNKMLKVLLSPDYLVAMRRRRSSDPLGDTATNLGNAMDDLMKHHPYLRVDATEAIVRLLNELVRLGSDPSFICWRANKDTSAAASTTPSQASVGGTAPLLASSQIVNRTLNTQSMNNASNVIAGDPTTAGGNENDDSSGEDEDDDDEMSSASQQQQQQRQNRSPPANNQQEVSVATVATNSEAVGTSSSGLPEREAIPLIDYILNVMKFIEAIFSNSSNGEHCREFVLHGGLTPILQLLSLPNLPVDSPVSTTAQAVANVCKSILNLAQETKVIYNALQQLAQIVHKLKPLIKQFSYPGGSVLLSELITCPKLEDGFSNADYTPILHNMSFVHGYVVMLVHLCRNASNEMRAILLKRWGADTETGVQLLQHLVQLYISLVWESTILLNLCSDEPSQQPDLLWDEVYATASGNGSTPTSSTASSSSSTSTTTSEAEVNLARKLERVNEFKTKLTPEEQFRYIKSLLAASSRLGRALAELLGTLVKLSVGTPQSRQRRNNEFLHNLSKVPTTEAREIARILSSILVNGFSHESILPKPAPKLKLTFLICSVGFTGPMLFDDKRASFHLMISQFCAENGLKAFFDMFYWALSLDNKTERYAFKQFIEPDEILTQLDSDTHDYPDGTGEFLDAWLQLLEKMVNPRAILESPYTMNPRSSPVSTTEHTFEPIFYLVQIHQLAMQALRRIWKRKPIHNYGITMTETIMCILKHLIKSHAMISERCTVRLKEIQNTKFVMDNLKNSCQRRTSDEGLNAEHVKTLSDMGFKHFHIVEALRNTPSLEDATDYLLNNPEASALSARSSRENLSTSGAAAGAVADATVNEAAATLQPSATSGNVEMEVDVELGAVGGKVSEDAQKETSESKENVKFELDYKDLKLISINVFDRFCEETLARTFAFMEFLPETTITGSELLAVVYRRHTQGNKSAFLANFVRNIVQWVEFALRVFNAPLAIRQARLDEITWGTTATKLYVRLKVASLLLDDMYADIRRPFCDAINNQNALKPLIKLLERMGHSLQERLSNGGKPSVPHWLHKLIELIDAIDNVSVIMQRKNNMSAVTCDIWKWYDASTGKWIAYSETNNQLIRNAYNAGERWVALNIGRQRYTISFNCMTQVSEASGSHRPVFPALKITEAIRQLNMPITAPLIDSVLTRTLMPRSECSTGYQDELLCLRSLVSHNDASNAELDMHLDIPYKQPPVPLGTSANPVPSGSNVATVAPTTTDSEAGSRTNENKSTPTTVPAQPQGVMTRSRTKSKNAAARAAAQVTPKPSTVPPPPPKRMQVIIVSEEPVGLARYDCAAIISCLVGLLQTTNLISMETKLTILKLCARMTKEYENARVFLKKGGIKILLQLQQSCGLMGFPTYAIVIIRHVLESPPVLQEAMERVLSMRASNVVPVGHRDLIYLLTQVSSAVARQPKVFLAAAKNMLKGEYLISPATYMEDMRLMVKAKFVSSTATYTSKASAAGTSASTSSSSSNSHSSSATLAMFAKEDQAMVQTSIDVIKELLRAIVQPCIHYGGVPTNESQYEPYVSAEIAVGHKPTAAVAAANTINIANNQDDSSSSKSSTSQPASVASPKKPLEKFEPCCCSWHLPSSGHTHLKPVLPRSTLLKVLADAVRSYQVLVPRVLMDHVYKPADSPLVDRDQSFMSFVLDHFLAIVTRQQVPEVSTMSKVLMSSLSDCYTQSAVQTKVVEEVHAAVTRALSQPDSAEKHTRLQVLMSLLPVMIESPMLYDKVHSHKNNMYRVLLRHGVMTYLTKIAQYKDLSNTNTLTTLSSILRPMEILLRLTIAPGSMASKRIFFAGGPHGTIINRRLYPRLTSRTTTVERANPLAERSSSGSNMGDGENVLRDIIRNVLSDRRHAFDFIFNADEMLVDTEEVTANAPSASGGVNVEREQERRTNNESGGGSGAANGGTASNGGGANAGRSTSNEPQLNFDRLWDDFLQSEGLRLVSRNQNSAGSGNGASSNVASASEHHAEPGGNDNGVAGGSDGASISSDTAAANVGNAASLMGEISTSESDSESNVSTENDERNEEEDDDDANEDDVEDHSETDGDEEPRQFIEVFDHHIFEPVSSETASNDADVDVDDDDDDDDEDDDDEEDEEIEVEDDDVDEEEEDSAPSMTAESAGGDAVTDSTSNTVAAANSSPVNVDSAARDANDEAVDIGGGDTSNETEMLTDEPEPQDTPSVDASAIEDDTEPEPPAPFNVRINSVLSQPLGIDVSSNALHPNPRPAPEPWGPPELTFIGRDGSVTTFIPPPAGLHNARGETNNASGNAGPGGPPGNPHASNVIEEHPATAICSSGIRRRLVYLDQQYCVTMPTYASPTEESQLELFSQDALHWWLEEAKHLDLESPIDTCLYIAHAMIPYLMKEIKVAQAQRKAEESNNGTGSSNRNTSAPGASSHTTQIGRRSSIPVLIQQTNSHINNAMASMVTPTSTAQAAAPAAVPVVPAAPTASAAAAAAPNSGGAGSGVINNVPPGSNNAADTGPPASGAANTSGGAANPNRSMELPALQDSSHLPRLRSSRTSRNNTEYNVCAEIDLTGDTDQDDSPVFIHIVDDADIPADDGDSPDDVQFVDEFDAVEEAVHRATSRVVMNFLQAADRRGGTGGAAPATGSAVIGGGVGSGEITRGASITRINAEREAQIARANMAAAREPLPTSATITPITTGTGNLRPNINNPSTTVTPTSNVHGHMAASTTALTVSTPVTAINTHSNIIPMIPVPSVAMPAASITAEHRHAQGQPGPATTSLPFGGGAFTAQFDSAGRFVTITPTRGLARGIGALAGRSSDGHAAATAAPALNAVLTPATHPLTTQATAIPISTPVSMFATMTAITPPLLPMPPPLLPMPPPLLTMPPPLLPMPPPPSSAAITTTPSTISTNNTNVTNVAVRETSADGGQATRMDSSVDTANVANVGAAAAGANLTATISVVPPITGASSAGTVSVSDTAAAAPAASTPSASSAVAVAAATATATAIITDMSPEVRAALGDLEVPEGVDPSFLAALPSEMREEVIQEHLRMQRIRQRAQQNAIQIAHDSLVEVNPEFLAALPPNIQTEVLMQQRIEQQRQAAQSANPDDPVDTAAFFQNLPDSLRQTILTDMEESQIASLPPELAAEAQFLRRDWESRNDTRIDVHPPQSNALSARFQSSLQGLHVDESRWHANSIWYDANGAPQAQNHHHTTIVHQHHGHGNGGAGGGAIKPIALLMMEDENILLDPDSLATLLLFLFIEDQKINNMRLHRVIRNLCHHEPTRDWVVNALINIIQKTNENKAKLRTTNIIGIKPQWLKLRVDAAFGYKSNIFIINKSPVDGKPKSISINPQAAQMIVRNCLDMLFVLAKHYPGSFVPFNREHKARAKTIVDEKQQIMNSIFATPALQFVGGGSNAAGGAAGASSSSTGSGAGDGVAPSADPPTAHELRARLYRHQATNHQSFAQACARLRQVEQRYHDAKYDDCPSTSKAAAAANRGHQKQKKGSSSSKHNSASSASANVPYNTNAKNFWDVLLNIDTQTPTRLSNVPGFPIKSQPDWQWELKTLDFLAFNDSPFGQLLQMLPFKVICRSPHLTDMLVKLLASLSNELPKEDDSGETVSSGIVVPPTITQPATVAVTRGYRDLRTGREHVTGIQLTSIINAHMAERLNMPHQLRSQVHDQYATAQALANLPPIPTQTSGLRPTTTATTAGASSEAGAAFVEPERSAGGKPTSAPAAAEQNSTTGNSSKDKPRRKIYAKNFSQLQLVIEVLTHQCGTTDGLDNVSKLIVNLTQCSQASNAIFLQYLTAAIMGLAEEVRQAIQTLLNEIHVYNTMDVSADKPSTSSASAQQLGASVGSGAVAGAASGSATLLTGGMSVLDGMMQDRFTAENVIISAPKNAKPTCELQLPSMKKLLSNSSAQPYFLRTLKIFMQVRDMFEAQKNTNTNTTPPTGAAAASNVAGDAGIDAAGATANADEAAASAAAATTGDVAGAGAGGDATSSAAAANPNTSAAQKPTLSQILCLDVLWNTLSECLAALEESKDEFAVLVLQPTVEAFFLIHASHKNSPKKPGRGSGSNSGNNGGSAMGINHSNAGSRDQINNSPTDESSNISVTTSSLTRHVVPCDVTAEACALLEEEANAAVAAATPNSALTAIEQMAIDSHEAQLKRDRQKFLQFAEKHRTVLNQILRQSPTHLSDGPFAVLVDHTRILDFDVKRKYFQTELERSDEGIRREENTVSVRRITVFEDSFRVLYRLGPEEWKNRFYIVFEDEEGQDAGGLLREWYVIISREIFNPMYALFCVSPGDRVTYMINPSSHANPNHLSYFKFVGRVIAKAIHDNKLLECYFTRSFYKHILSKQVKYTDMESQDYEFYKGLDYLMKNDISTLGYELTFSTEVQEFGVTQIRDLIPNGRDIAVTEENKFDYVQLVCQLKMSGSIRQQLDAFLEGFYDIIPKHLISIFNEQELELLISGLPDIDIEDLKANTEYHKYTSKSLQIQWFWRALRSFDQADRAKFLQFVTGTSKVPLQGFGSLEGMNGIQKFQIHRDDRSTDRLPCAHTCFNQLDLPMYKSYDKLRSCMLKAIHECSEGFGFA